MRRTMKNNIIHIHKFTHKNFSTLLQKYEYNLKIGDIVAGIIFSIEDEGALIDIGAAKAAYLPFTEITALITKNSGQILRINETFEFIILNCKQYSNQIILSLRYLEYMRAWKRIKQMQMEDTISNLKILSYNKGGGIVNLEGLKGFVPNSHLINFMNKKNFINKIIPLKLLEVDEYYNTLVLSSICAIFQQYKNKFFIGKVLTGIIADIQSYGLFVDIGNITGLLHISEISDQYILDLHEIFKVGESIKVMIIHLDITRGRISFSTKRINNFKFTENNKQFK
uniref:ribosomal protein S1 n=1 Tax=Glaucosphaera vacuolata TaxID=38265 RepID=UPI001FCD0D96|nr:ribosomal protein S1 [Glaucosphaera vacuolata]UNJ18673.1 ribosomal protein S1 [Glaucosphaera vacuolata]